MTPGARRSPDWIVTPDNRRGMITLLGLLAERGEPLPAARAASALAGRAGPVTLCTGFPVAGRPETDGPPGAIALASALLRLGREVTILSWPEVLAMIAPELRGVTLRALDPARHAPAEELGDLVVIEVCGQNALGAYRNMRGEDISAVAPRFERAVGLHALIAVGDGGNEFGMGSAPAAFYEIERPRFAQPVSTCDVLVAASVSNWGAYAIVAELSAVSSEPLLPAPQEHARMIERLVAAGAVCGVTGEQAPRVDGRELRETCEILERLAGWAAGLR